MLSTPAREYAPGMGQAVADRTINRKITKAVTPYVKTIHIPRQDDTSLDEQVASWCKSNGFEISSYHVTHGDDVLVEIELTVTAEVQTETWADVAARVALGNSLLHPLDEDNDTEQVQEFAKMHHHLRQASILMSGRHLQHGDVDQPNRPMEVFTNCSTSAASFLTFYLLLNGSGVGRAYDDAMIVTDLRNLPIVECVVDSQHKDVLSGEINCLDLRNAKHLYGQAKIVHYMVPDSREGWAKAIEKMELMAFAGTERDTVLLLDFSNVRCKGSPIKGMQGRPASGPGPLIAAIKNVAKLRDAGMAPWRSAIYADHYLAECVLVGGARRAARMSTKDWRDKTVLDFIEVKRGGFLWSSNNSVTVDQEYWDAVKMREKAGVDFYNIATPLEMHAVNVHEALCAAAYHDGTGEPGIITVDKLTYKDTGTEVFDDGNFAKSARYQLEAETLEMTKALVKAWKGCRYKVITNPCGEIVLIMLGGYCVIADVVPFHAGYALSNSMFPSSIEAKQAWDDDAEDAYRVATRALIRTNLMDSLYKKEVERTNRIGVGITGLHEYAWARFGYGFRDIIDEQKAMDFWLTLSRFKRAVKDEATKYATELGVAVPHTDTTIKPAGTTSKLFGLTEGAHLPSMREFLRWVQFRNGDPLIEEYRQKGYPVRQLRIYAGTTIVGFPTAPTICQLGMGSKLVTAAEATPEEQYQYLRLLEKYWITGVEEDGVTPLSESGNQVSYTLKFDPERVSFEEFKRTLLEGQSTVRCCSVMPQADTSSYEYQPEQPVTKHEYEAICQAVAEAAAGNELMKEDVGLEHVACEGGACPIDFGTNSASA
jgi:adenosylcobalamin-dependent ribonucleoside-triphosphate reductase